MTDINYLRQTRRIFLDKKNHQLKITIKLKRTEKNVCYCAMS